MDLWKRAVDTLCGIPAVNKQLALVAGLCVSNAFLPRTALEDFIKFETPIAKTSLLANIGPEFQGAPPGIVVASPSRGVGPDPDYVYTWTRDSSLVFKLLIDQHIRGDEKNLEPLIRGFIESEAKIQQVSNPSGDVSSGGLGEPKFHINLTEFTDPWGRPQRDGPALRSISTITYANHLLSVDNTTKTYVNETLWPMIELDLVYVAKYWNYSTFDLWEEVASSSFFTTVVQHRALREGIRLGLQLQRFDARTVDKLTEQAAKLLCFMQTYWNPSGGFMTANTGGGRSGIDSNTVLSSIHTFDPEAGCSAETFQPCSDRALANLKVYVDSFRKEYAINAGIHSPYAVATGRYKEDFYFGGNPWYLTTAACAEQLYDAIIVWRRQGYIDVTPISLAFFTQFYPSLEPGRYMTRTTTYRKLFNSVKAHADEFLSVVAAYTPDDGSLAEQFGRANGRPLSAKRLTWSYAALLTAFAAREGKFQTPWDAKSATLGVCSNGRDDLVRVTFRVRAETAFGENVYLTGSADALRLWSAAGALRLSAENYPIWSTTVSLPAHHKVEYKYLRKTDGKDGVVWMSDPNNLVTPDGREMTLDDVWR